MAIFGQKSRDCLNTVHPDLVKIHERVIGKYNFDHYIYEGLRTDEKQLEYFLAGKSKLDPRNDDLRKSAKHLKQADGYSHATDSAPYPIYFGDGNDKKAAKARARFYMFAGYMFSACAELLSEGKITHTIRWGGDWDSDKDFNDQSFDDLPHFELRKI